MRAWNPRALSFPDTAIRICCSVSRGVCGCADALLLLLLLIVHFITLGGAVILLEGAVIILVCRPLTRILAEDLFIFLKFCLLLDRQCGFSHRDAVIVTRFGFEVDFANRRNGVSI